MFTIEEKNNFPIKVWLKDISEIDDIALEQAKNLSTLPFLHKWVALMADTHAGMGMPIGGVIATIDTIIPNAVGVDIGCGMNYVSTNISLKILRETKTPSGSLIQAMVGDILRNIPVGFKSHEKSQECKTMDEAKNNIEMYEDTPELLKYINLAYKQVGTLGGGNHFIEFQEDEEGFLSIMIHSGSRNFGKQVCDYFNKQAQIINQQQHPEIPKEYRLAFLSTESKVGQQYINWMNLALNFAMENRQRMMKEVKSIVDRWVGGFLKTEYKYSEEINCHHNYASLERHYDKDVWVHRKGAIRAKEGELAVIPGAMGSYSYVVTGLGNKESFNTSSHGAGRKYSRTGARKQFTVMEVMEDLNKQKVVIGTPNKRDIAEESRFAYKNIKTVMENQKDLARPIKTLKTVGVVKG